MYFHPADSSSWLARLWFDRQETDAESDIEEGEPPSAATAIPTRRRRRRVAFSPDRDIVHRYIDPTSKQHVCWYSIYELLVMRLEYQEECAETRRRQRIASRIRMQHPVTV